MKRLLTLLIVALTFAFSSAAPVSNAVAADPVAATDSAVGSAPTSADAEKSDSKPAKKAKKGKKAKKAKKGKKAKKSKKAHH